MKPQESIQVYGRRNSLNVQKVMWTLGELDLPYQRHDVGGSFGFPDDYAQLNPNRVVPTLRDGELVLWESGAIVRYLARRYGLGTLWPEEPTIAARADQWMDWHKDKVSFGFFDIFINRIRLAPEACDEAAVQRGIRLCAQQFQLLDTHLANSAYLAGAAFSFGDVPMGAMTWRYLQLDITDALQPLEVVRLIIIGIDNQILFTDIVPCSSISNGRRCPTLNAGNARC